jgi:hypothetical protein
MNWPAQCTVPIRAGIGLGFYAIATAQAADCSGALNKVISKMGVYSCDYVVDIMVKQSRNVIALVAMRLHFMNWCLMKKLGSIHERKAFI